MFQAGAANSHIGLLFPALEMAHVLLDATYAQAPLLSIDAANMNLDKALPISLFIESLEFPGCPSGLSLTCLFANKNCQLKKAPTIGRKK